MLDNITPIDSLHKEAAEIQSYLEITVSEQPEEALERGNELGVYVARTGKMLADAQYHRDSLMKSEIMELLSKTSKASDLSPSTVNKLLDAACKDANYIVTWCERLNRTATHQLDWCRSLLSKAKAELSASYGVSGARREKDNTIF